MFSVGDEVVCVDDGWDESEASAVGKCPLEKGRIYTVEGVYVPGDRFGSCIVFDQAVSVGVHCEAMRIAAEECGSILPHCDIWRANRFRRIQKRDISEGLALLKGLTETTRTPEVVGA